MKFDICEECGHWLARDVPGCRCALKCHPHLKEPDYKVRCQECQYSRSFGNAKITAESKAVNHSLTRGHRVKITNHGRLYIEVRPDPQEGTLMEVPF